MITAQALLNRMSPATIVSLLRDMNNAAYDWEDNDIRQRCIAQLVILEGAEEAAADLEPLGLEVF